jgi:CDP-paratose 2-epimerase
MRLPNAVQWFTFEQYKDVEAAIAVLKQLQINFLRINASWADYERPGGPEWFDYLFPKFAREKIELLPCFFYTPLQLARLDGGSAKTSNPPQNLRDYADFVKMFLGKYGETCSWVQVWNEPNNSAYWNQDLDADGKLFAQMAGFAIDVAHDFGKKVVLGGLSPTDYNWIQRMFDYGVLGKCQALGTHAFEGTWSRNRHTEKPEMPWMGWEEEVAGQRQLFAKNGCSDIQVWITETGYSTWGNEAQRKSKERDQIQYFDELLTAPADQIFWFSLFDQKPGTTTDNVLNMGKELDNKAFHFGVIDFQGQPKALFDHWQSFALKHAA